MKKLLDDVVAGKRAYQRFTIEHGIERICVRIPIKDSRAFETAFQSALTEGIADKTALLQIVEKHNGAAEAAKKA